MKHIITILIITATLSSCEKTINIQIPDEGRKLTVNSFFVQDSNMIVSLTKSRYILDGKFEFDPVNDANVTIFKDGDLIEKLTEIHPGTYQSSFILNEISSYQIEVSSNEFPNVKAESYLPEKTDIIDFSLSNQSVNEYGEQINKFSLQFKDNPDTENFYFVQVYKYVIFYDWETGEETDEKFLETQYLYSDDPNTFQEWGIGEGLLVSDELLSGKEYSLSFSSYSYTYYDSSTNENDSTTYYVKFHTVSKDYYQYYKTLAKHKEATDEFFMEPVQVYNNIENGFGIFAGLSTAVDSVKVKQQGY
ncbi:MAG: hypothetical protein DRI95_15295 [Bacteroidetes bacterium]|nr:MAG: hypothetical protein DRI95_15295 [Bacteroidota bacterium]